LQFIEVARSGEILICAPRGGRVSFFNSPYRMHFELRAVDIYPKSPFAPSPVAGKVVAIRKFAARKPKYFRAPRHDYIIVIQPKSSAKVVRILHVTPHIEIGQLVEVGDQLGRILRSGFYDFWTDPHLHVEVRPKEDFIRARGGMLLEPKLGKVKPIKGPRMDFKAKVASCKPEYVLLRGVPTAKVGVFTGLSVSIDGRVGVLDGGVPHYGWGAVMGENLYIDGKIFLGEFKIGGLAKGSAAKVARFMANPFSVKLNNLQVFGLSCYLSLSNKFLLKVVPKTPGAIDVSGKVEITLNQASL